MIDAVLTRRNRIKTLIFLVVCGLSAIGSVILGIEDNLPGILLAFLAATAFILAFTHTWRTVRKFMFLLLASVISLVLFVILNIILDSFTQIDSPTINALIVTFAMIISAAFLVGAIGSVAMFVRSRRETP